LALATQGGQRVTLHGSNFGPAVAPDDVMRLGGLGATYANGSLVATGCEVSVEHVAITCVTAPGTGKGHAWAVRVGYQTSTPFLPSFSGGVTGTQYAPPVVTGFAVVDDPGASVTALATEGGQWVAITGRNFGPSVRTLTSVTYHTSLDSASPSTVFAVDVQGCYMAVPHEEVVCRTAPGAGAGLQWLLVVGGQESTNPTTAYAPPEVHGVVAVGVQGGAGVDVAALSSDGGTTLLLVGAHFGPPAANATSKGTFLCCCRLCWSASRTVLPVFPAVCVLSALWMSSLPC
jgi:hypothetical protein